MPSLFKNFRFRNGPGLHSGREFYNFFNHAQWSTFRTNFGAADFGAAISARDARDIQLGLRLFF